MGKTRLGVVVGIVLTGAVFVGVAEAAVGAHPVASDGANGRVEAIAFSGTTAYLGGQFTTVGTAARSRAAAINTTTGKVTAFNPNVNGTVQAVAVSGSTVFLGGSFTKVGNKGAARLAAVNATTGAVIWTATLDKQVASLAVRNGWVYAGGYFTTANGSPRSYLAAFNATTGALNQNWKPSVDLEVKAIGVTSDNSEVIVGGDFSHLNGASASHLGAVSATTGATQTWKTHTPYQIVAMWVDSSGIYIGGAGGGGNFAKFTQTGSESWQGGTDGNVQAITELGGVVYVGGHFPNYCGPQKGQHTCGSPVARDKLLAVDATSGALQPWDPSANSVLGVFALTGSGSTLAVGGDFTSTGQRSQPHFALYR